MRWRAAGRATAYVLAALYFLLDEALASVRRLARYLAPLAWYFNAVKTMRNALRRHGMRHPSGWVRQATPFATLPFIIVPGLLLIPAKLYFAALLVTRPLYAGGGLVAGGVFVLPSLFILVALSWIYMAYGELPVVAGLFYGIKPAVTAVVLTSTSETQPDFDDERSLP